MIVIILVNKQKIVSIRQTPSFPHNSTGVSLRFILRDCREMPKKFSTFLTN